jgi:intron-binding protein aquarius
VSEPGSPEASGNKRVYRVALDPLNDGCNSVRDETWYQTLNLVVRHGKENNFKAVLETVRGLMAWRGPDHRVIPPALNPFFWDRETRMPRTSPVLCKYSRKTVGVANPDAALDYGDTFLEHVQASFPGITLSSMGVKRWPGREERRRWRQLNYRVRAIVTASLPLRLLLPISRSTSKGILLRFTPIQVGAIRSGAFIRLDGRGRPAGNRQTDVAVSKPLSLVSYGGPSSLPAPNAA